MLTTKIQPSTYLSIDECFDNRIINIMLNILHHTLCLCCHCHKFHEGNRHGATSRPKNLKTITGKRIFIDKLVLLDITPGHNANGILLSKISSVNNLAANNQKRMHRHNTFPLMLNQTHKCTSTCHQKDSR